LARHGAQTVTVCGSDLHAGVDFAFDGSSFFYRGECLDDVATRIQRRGAPVPLRGLVARVHAAARAVRLPVVLGYVAGAQQYVELEPPPELCERLRGFTAALGLTLAGVDFIATDDGRYVCLEANSSPSYLDIEEKTGWPGPLTVCPTREPKMSDAFHGPCTPCRGCRTRRG
jgi:hypothetical protein